MLALILSLWVRPLLHMTHLEKATPSIHEVKHVKRSFGMKQCAMVMSVVAPLTLGMAPAQRTPSAMATATETCPGTSKFTGRELYQGMYFGVGEAAKLFPEIWESEQIKKYAPREGREKEFEQAAYEITKVIETKNPEFFTRFAAGLQSGKHATVEATLKLAREQTHLAVATLRDIPVASVADLVRSQGGSSPVADVWLYQETAVAAVAVAVVVVVAFAIDFTPLVDRPNQSQLQMESFVDALANKQFAAY